MKSTRLLQVAFLISLAAVLLLAGCGEQKNDSAVKAAIEKRKAETMARLEAVRADAAAPAPDEDPDAAF